jgi:hypothetical protein
MELTWPNTSIPEHRLVRIASRRKPSATVTRMEDARGASPILASQYSPAPILSFTQVQSIEERLLDARTDFKDTEIKKYHVSSAITMFKTRDRGLTFDLQTACSS